MEEYIELLKEEFKNATNLLDEVEFYKWLKDKKEFLKNYGIALEYLGLSDKVLIELNKGNYDTVAISLPNEKIIEVSKYAKTINRKNVISIQGSLIYAKKPIVVSANNEILNSEISSNATYLTQLPYNTSTKMLLETLVLNNRNICIGTYGSITDLDRQKKLNNLHCFKKELQTFKTNLKVSDVDFVLHDGYYSALKVEKCHIKS